MPDSQPPVDHLGRPFVPDDVKGRIAEALRAIPEGKRGVVLVVADERGNARGHFAARIGKTGDLKVAAGAGWKFDEKRPAGYIGVEWAF